MGGGSNGGHGVSALLEFSSCARRVDVMSCYAPTRAASCEEKDDFF